MTSIKSENILEITPLTTASSLSGGSSDTCEHTEKGIPKTMCLPLIPQISDERSCLSREIDSQCLTATPLAEEEKMSCDSQTYCFYAALRIAASCKVALDALSITSDTDHKLRSYCNSMCKYPAAECQVDECEYLVGDTSTCEDSCPKRANKYSGSSNHIDDISNSDCAPNIYIPTTLLECIQHYYTLQATEGYYTTRDKHCVGDVNTPFCLNHCRDFGQATLDPSRFICTY